MANATKYHGTKHQIFGSKPLLFDVCSDMKNAARGSATTLTPDLSTISPMETDQCI